MFYVTGDIHGKPQDLIDFAKRFELTQEDTIIILGDAGFNFYGNKTDIKNKEKIAAIKPTFFCIHGNHEARPHTIESYKTKEWNGGTVWYEENYPNLLFAKDGEIYNFDGNQCLVVGGAYSVDKYWRFYNLLIQKCLPVPSSVISSLEKILNNDKISKAELDKLDDSIDKLIEKEHIFFYWWKNELPNEETIQYIEKQIEKNNRKVDIVLSHTCPFKYIPVEVFLSGINQSTVDNSLEHFLDDIENTLSYSKWYCGHWHTDKKIDKMQFMFHAIDVL